jgi:hypothetical protein
MKRRLQGLLPYAALLLGAAFLYSNAGSFAASGRPGQLGPDFWPRAVLALLMLVCALEIVRRAVFEPAEANAAEADAQAIAGPTTHHEEPVRYPWLLAAGIGLTILYVPGMEILGFFLSTALYLAAFMVAGRYRRGTVIAVTSLLGSLAFLFVFMKIVYVSLPLGVGPFRHVSAWILAALGIR